MAATTSARRTRRDAKALLRFGLVAGVHVAVLFALAQFDPEVRKQVEPVIVSLITPPRPPEPTPPPPVAEPPPKPQLKALPKPSPAAPKPAIALEPSPSAISTEPTPAIAAPAPAEAAASASSEAPRPPSVAAIQLPAPVAPPRFDAAYLNNPRPEYPRVARRMGEHGKVMLRVYVTAAGAAGKVEIRTSSGSARLDQAAREAVERWKFVPARQGEEPVAAWVLVPITFVLEG